MKLAISLIAGLLVGVALTYGLATTASRKIETSLPESKIIYTVPDDATYGDVSVFNDEGNRCYIIYPSKSFSNNAGTAISCVKQQ